MLCILNKFTKVIENFMNYNIILLLLFTLASCQGGIVNEDFSSKSLYSCQNSLPTCKIFESTYSNPTDKYLKSRKREHYDSPQDFAQENGQKYRKKSKKDLSRKSLKEARDIDYRKKSSSKNKLSTEAKRARAIAEFIRKYDQYQDNDQSYSLPNNIYQNDKNSLNLIDRNKMNQVRKQQRYQNYEAYEDSDFLYILPGRYQFFYPDELNDSLSYSDSSSVEMDILSNVN